MRCTGRCTDRSLMATAAESPSEKSLDGVFDAEAWCIGYPLVLRLEWPGGLPIPPYLILGVQARTASMYIRQIGLTERQSALPCLWPAPEKTAAFDLVDYETAWVSDVAGRACSRGYRDALADIYRSLLLARRVETWWLIPRGHCVGVVTKFRDT